MTKIEKKSIKKVYDYFLKNGINDELNDVTKDRFKTYLVTITDMRNRLAQAERCLMDMNIEPTKTFTNVKGQTYTRKLVSYDADYTPQDICNRFNSDTLTKIWFLNTHKQLCLVQSAFYDSYEKKVVLNIKLFVKNEFCKLTKMTLDRFLYLIETGEFVVTNKVFNEEYLKPYYQSNTYGPYYAYLKQNIQDLTDMIDEYIFDNLDMNDLERKYNNIKEYLETQYKRVIEDENKDCQ